MLCTFIFHNSALLFCHTQISKNNELKHKRPTPQPQDFEDIEY